MEFSTLLARAVRGTVAGVPVLLPSREDMVSIAVGEAGGNAHYRVRDLADLHVLRDQPGLDWEYAKRQLAEHGLEYDLNQLSRWRDTLMYGDLRVVKPVGNRIGRPAQGMRELGLRGSVRDGPSCREKLQ